MMRSMFASVSGLKAHQTKMDVIGNNIANVNTVGFKASRATFQEVFSQTLSGAGAPDVNRGTGGTNPMQIGLGMSVGGVDMMTTSGSLQRTDSPTDLSIEGEGFFIVRGGENGIYQFTRAGNFGIDKLGNLNLGGLNVMGWQEYTTDEEGNITYDTRGEVEPINLYEDEHSLNKRIIAAKATTEAILAGTLDTSEEAVGGYTGEEVTSGSETAAINEIVDTDGDGIPEDASGENIDAQFIVPMRVYDALGNEYKVNISFWKNFVDSDDLETSWYYTISGDDNSKASAFGFLKFDNEGQIITDEPTDFNVTPTMILTPNASVGAKEIEINLDFTKVSMSNNSSSVKPSQVDGYPPGTLVTFSIGADGILTGVYSNGRQKPLAQLGLAVFSNPAGLQRSGSNLFIPTTNSGEFDMAIKPGDGEAGSLNPGTLEMSNVDLAKQFTEMIITQRGFQANSRIMTTSDEILQELANMKR